MPVYASSPAIGLVGRRSLVVHPPFTCVDMQGPGSDIFKLVMMVMKRGYDPFIVFSFSKKECENLALSLSGLDLNNQDEKQLVEGIFKNAIDLLSEEDQRLPQIGALLPMLKRGIGVHHSGLLPILKELVELLFQVNADAKGGAAAVQAPLCLVVVSQYSKVWSPHTLATLPLASTLACSHTCHPVVQGCEADVCLPRRKGS